MLARLFPLILFVLISMFATANENALSKADERYRKGYYYESIALLENLHDDTLTAGQQSQQFQLLADNHLQLGNAEVFRKFSLSSFFALEKPDIKDSVLYYSNLAEYYHYMLRIDSSVYHANKSVELLNRCAPCKGDSILIARVYMVHGNCLRNERKSSYYTEKVDRFHKFLEYRNATAFQSLDTALAYAADFQKPLIIRRKAAHLHDMSAYFTYPHRGKKRPEGYEQIFNECIETYHTAIALAEKYYEKPHSFISRCYLLMGLTYHFNSEFEIADSLGNLAIENALENEDNIYLMEYCMAVTYKATNYNVWYEETKNETLLFTTLKMLEKAVPYWEKHKAMNIEKNKGYNDRYVVSVNNRIPYVCYQLYNITGDPEYMDKALFYSDRYSYNTYPKNYRNDSLTVNVLKNELQPDEALVHYMISSYPGSLMAIFVTHDSTHFFELKRKARNKLISDKDFSKINGSEGLKVFTEHAYMTYQRLFQPIDELLKANNIENVILIPILKFARINFDLLISDTLNTTWKDQPYMFKKYNISYAMSPSIFLDNNRPVKSLRTHDIGILTGDFNLKTNLRFTGRLNDKLQQTFSANVYPSLKKEAFSKTINSHKIFMLQGHGEASYHDDEAVIYISDSVFIKDYEFYDMNLTTDLFITTACKADQTFTYRSEGAVGGYTKTLQYAGARSTLTSLWELDDKTNYLILTYFFQHLKKGHSKSRALWLAKKDYWKHSEQDEAFNPFFWASYKLTGNTAPLSFQENKSPFRFWWLLILPGGILVWYKIRRLKYASTKSDK